MGQGYWQNKLLPMHSSDSGSVRSNLETENQNSGIQHHDTVLEGTHRENHLPQLSQGCNSTSSRSLLHTENHPPFGTWNKHGNPSVHNALDQRSGFHHSTPDVKQIGRSDLSQRKLLDNHLEEDIISNQNIILNANFITSTKEEIINIYNTHRSNNTANSTDNNNFFFKITSQGIFSTNATHDDTSLNSTHHDTNHNQYNNIFQSTQRFLMNSPERTQQIQNLHITHHNFDRIWYEEKFKKYPRHNPVTADNEIIINKKPLVKCT
jgi:hypothetical protein